MTIDDFMDDIDLDSALEDLAQDCRATTVLRMMALLSIGTDPYKAWAAAAELAAAIGELDRSEAAAKQKIAAILARRGWDYQRGLFYIMAGRGLFANWTELSRLLRLLDARRKLLDYALAGEHCPKPPVAAYRDKGGEGPRGAYDAEFDLSDVDRRYIADWGVFGANSTLGTGAQGSKTGSRR